MLEELESRSPGLKLARDGTDSFEASRVRCDKSGASYSIIGIPEWAWEFTSADSDFSVCEGSDGGPRCKP